MCAHSTISASNARGKLPFDYVCACNSNLGTIAIVSNVKVRWGVIVEVHCDHYAEESADLGHLCAPHTRANKQLIPTWSTHSAHRDIGPTQRANGPPLSTPNPTGGADDIMGPDGYRTSLLFQHGMPELRSDPRFARLCARLGLVEFWMTTGKWPDCAGEVPYDFKAECAKVRNVPKEGLWL